MQNTKQLNDKPIVMLIGDSHDTPKASDKKYFGTILQGGRNIPNLDERMLICLLLKLDLSDQINDLLQKLTCNNVYSEPKQH